MQNIQILNYQKTIHTVPRAIFTLSVHLLKTARHCVFVEYVQSTPEMLPPTSCLALRTRSGFPDYLMPQTDPS